MATALSRALGIAGGAAVFAQRVDGKGLTVDKLLVVNGVALAVEHDRQQPPYCLSMKYSQK